MASPKQLSVCMIVRNEATRLEGAIESVRGVADEIVVVDTGSNDATPELAARLGARVSSFEWTEDFAAARNESIRRATKDWILALDADQRLDPDSRERLRALIQTDAFRGYLLRYRNYLGDEQEEVENIDLRLFPNDDVLRYVRAVHEQVVSTRPDRKLHVVLTDVLVHHYGSRLEVRKAARYAAILERMLADDPSDGLSAAYLGMAHAVVGDDDRAADAYRRALAAGARVRGRRVPPYVVSAHIGLARVCLNARCWDDAAAEARSALVHDPGYFDARLALAAAELGLGRPRAALSHYRRALQSPHGAPWHPTGRPLWRAHLGVADSLVQLGDLAGAADAIERAAETAPRHPLVEDRRQRLERVRRPRRPA